MKTTLNLLAAATVCCSAQLASAALTLDFTAAAEGNERGYGFGDSIVVDGQTVKLYAWNTTEASLTTQSLDGASFDAGGPVSPATATEDGPFAYMDDDDGGLGAAQTLNKGLDAVPASDDDVGPAGGIQGGREVVGIQLMNDATITRLTFKASDHTQLPSGSKIDITFDNGDTWSEYTIGAGGVLDLSKLYDMDDKIGLAYTGTKFYLSTVSTIPVPEPASVAVWAGLALAVGGCGAVRRRRQIAD